MNSGNGSDNLFVSTPACTPPLLRVSIVMAAYNTANHIERAIRSVQAQSVSDWELIIVDDGSLQLTQNDQRIVAVANTINGGPSKS